MKKTCGPLIFSFIGGSILSCVLGLSAGAETGVAEKQIEEKELEPVLLPSTLLDQKGDKVSAAVLEGKFVGLYFSASWCGPCRAFTPSLIKFREAHKNDFEVILVGADGSPKAQANYMKKYKMPWLALTNRVPRGNADQEVTWSSAYPLLGYFGSRSENRQQERKKRNCPLGRSGIRYLEKDPEVKRETIKVERVSRRPA